MYNTSMEVMMLFGFFAAVIGGFFVADTLVRQLFERITTHVLLVPYSLVGFAIVAIAVLIDLLRDNQILFIFDSLVAAVIYGIGFGVLAHHFLYKGFLLSQDREVSLRKRYKTQINRALEILPGFLTYFVLLSPFLLAIGLPTALIYIVIAANVYWLYKAFRIALFVIIGFRKMKAAESTVWMEKLNSEYPEDLSRLYHLFAIPTYKESLEVLEPNIQAIVDSDYPKERLFIALGLEEKDKEIGPRNADYLIKKYGDKIGGFFVSVNVLKEGELQGPATNRNTALRNAKLELDKKGILLEDVLVTTLDADFVIHKQFVAGATYRYLSTPIDERDKRSYTGAFLYNNNYWQTSAPMRVIAVSTAFWQLSEMAYSDKYINFASLTMNFASLWDLGLWIPDKVNDDSGFYWKAYFHFNGDYKVVPHFVPLSADAVQDVSFAKTLQNQYLQFRRWAYGVEHIPFIVKSYFSSPKVPFLDKTDKLLFVFWGYGSWATLALLVTFGGMIIPLVNPEFDKTVQAQNLPVVSSWILTMAFLTLFLTVYSHEKIVPPRPTNWGVGKKIMSFLQWFLVPLIILTYGTIPAIDAQTRLMLGRYMSFRVTNKARKQ